MILTDGELQKLIERQDTPILTDYDPPADWNDKDSLVQPCSIDLHIGAVYQPGVKPGKAGSATNPKSELVLRTGQTAIVATKESIHLPGDYAGYGFPPSHISSRALLMTNPGHIDPGYSGKLQFTVINMGREDYTLRSKDLIVTVLIFKLSNKVNADYAARYKADSGKVDSSIHGSGLRAVISKLATQVSAFFAPGTATGGIHQADIDRLSPDFVDVQKRATSIARKTLGYTTVGASVLAVMLGWAFNAVDKRLEGIDEIKVRLTKLEDANNSLAGDLQATKTQLEKQIEIDDRLTKLELESHLKGAPK